MRGALLPAAGLLWAAAAAADGAWSLVGGTTGLGLEYTTGLTERWQGRAGYRGYNFDTDLEGEISTGGQTLDYSGDFKFRGAFGLLDFHPTAGRFHTTAGLMYNASDVEVNARCRDPGGCEVGDRIVLAGLLSVSNGVTVETITAEAEFRSAAAYLGLGWGNPLLKDRGWSWRAEAGVLLLGAPDIELSSTGSCQSDPDCRRALEQEEQELEDDAEDFQYYPVVNLALSYRF